MKIGDIIESAIWLSGDETVEDRQRFEQDVTTAIAMLCNELGFYHGLVTFTEKRPEEDRVPEVPDHIQGSRVRLLVAEAEVVGKCPESPQGSFIANLDRKDLVRLRKVTRKAHAKNHPHGEDMTDPEVDEIIERYGPDAALETLRRKDLLQ